MSTALHMHNAHGAQIYFGDLPPYVYFGLKEQFHAVVITSVPDLLHFSTDPDPAMDPALVVSDLQDVNKKYFLS
jgi:hypothetical protein